MNLNELKTTLQARPGLTLAITLPDGRRVPPQSTNFFATCPTSVT